MVFDSKKTPFEPDRSVNPNNFKGREDKVLEATRYFKQVVNGTPQHLFITGQRGFGKSSFARYLGKIAAKKCNMVSVHLYLHGTSNIDTLIKNIIEKIVSETEENWRDKISRLFGDKIKSATLGGLSFEFNASKEDLDSLKPNFANVLVNIINKAGYNEDNGKKGLFIVLDDINGLTNTPDFANWYKSFADTLSTDFDGNAPIYMVISGLPEKQHKLFDQNESFSRIFHYMELGKLNEKEIEDFYYSSFTKSTMQLDKTALDTMINYSSGFPTMMQQIGESVFWEDDDYYIDENDALKGIIEAGNQIGQKYLRPIIESQITNEEYIPIIKKFGKHKFHIGMDEFTENEMSVDFEEQEIVTFKRFLSRAEKAGVIESVDFKKCSYKFTNNLYPVYFKILKLKNEYKML